ncbi:hypothetical protein V8C43DRAFT_252505 [Trichoderma afarasin]
MDEIDKNGSIEQKQKCLENFLVHRTRGILPVFYSPINKGGIRYPSDGGPDPQVGTDHESVEGEADEPPMEAKIVRTKRGRHVERRRQNTKDSRARRLVRRSLAKDRKILKSDPRTFIDLEKLGAALGRKWPIYPEFQVVINQLQKVRDGREAEVSLLTLDTELISASRRVLEVAIGELHSGRVLLDAKVDHQCTTRELFQKLDGRPMTTALKKITF